MKIIRAYLLKWYLTAPLALLTVLVSCESKNESIKPSLASYSGKELFEGLMFAKGEVTTLFPELEKGVMARASLKGELLDDILELEEEMIRTIEVKNPKYFDKFKSSITSGKHLAIKEAMIGGGKMIEVVAYDMLGSKVDMKALKTEADRVNQQYDVKDFMNEDGSVNIEKLEEVKISSEAVNGKMECIALLLAVAAVAVYAWHWFWPKSVELDPTASVRFDSNNFSLAEEQLINAIANQTNKDSHLLTYN